MAEQRQTTSRQTAADGQRRESSLKTVSSEALFEGGRRLGIQHGDQFYTLMVTRSGKLILTK